MRITLNGAACELEEGMHLLALLEREGMDPRRVAVERNREVVPRARLAGVQLGEGDVLEVVHMVGGG